MLVAGSHLGAMLGIFNSTSPSWGLMFILNELIKDLTLLDFRAFFKNYIYVAILFHEPYCTDLHSVIQSML